MTYITAFLLISLVTGSALIVYPVFFHHYYPNKDNIDVFTIAVLLFSYELGRLINYLFNKSIISKLKLKNYFWVAIAVNLLFNLLFCYSETTQDIILIRFILGLFSLQNNLQLILNTIFNMKNTKVVRFISLIPNLIIILNFNIGYLLYSSNDDSTFVSENKSNYNSEEKNLYGNKSVFDNIMNNNITHHFIPALFISCENLLLMVFLLFSKSISFDDCSYGTMGVNNNADVENYNNNAINNNISNISFPNKHVNENEVYNADRNKKIMYLDEENKISPRESSKL